MNRWAAVAVFLFAWTLSTHGKYSASGDEPHYLMMAQSIVADGDLDLANNYAQNDGRLFGHDGLDIGLHAVPSRTGHTRSIHDVGLGVALVPVYFVAQQIAGRVSPTLLRRFRMDRGLFAYSIVGLFLMGMTAFGLRLLADAVAPIAGPTAAVGLVLVVGISPPIVSHSFLVFPEVVALFVTCAAVWFALKPPASSDSRLLIPLTLAIGALPWTHHKFALYAPALLALVAGSRWPLVRRRLLLLVVFAAPQAALAVWSLREWGTVSGALTTAAFPFSLGTFQSGWAGLWVDRRSGLLAYAPIYWIVPAAAALTVRRTWPYLLAALPVYLPAAAFVIGWWAGFSPAARYLVPVIPLFVVVIAHAMRFRIMRAALVTLAVPQALLDAVVWNRPRWLWPAGGANAALDALGSAGRAYASLLPDLQSNAALSAGAIATVAMVMCGLTAVLVVGSRRRNVAEQEMV